MRIVLIALLLLCEATVATAQRQWTLTAESGLNRFSRAAHDTSTPTVSLGAWHATSYTLRLARRDSAGEVAISVGYTSAPFAAWIDNVAVIQGGELALIEFGATYGRRLARSVAGAVLRAEAGPVLHIWTMSGEDARARLGGVLGTVVELPVTARWRVDLRADLTFTRSLLRPEDEDAEITRESSMRRGRLAIGLTRRL